MATSLCRLGCKTNLIFKHCLWLRPNRSIHLTAALEKTQAGKYKVSLNHDKPLTYEQANAPHRIGHRKAWNSWNTSCLLDGPRASETAVEDIFIRKFMFGTWHRLFLSEVIIKRRHNMIFIGGLIKQALIPRKIYFLIGYTEEILSYILKCPVKLELQSVENPKDVIFKYI
ncbi:28S ribosomal protein S24, mitochondrial-like [Centruroides sculpturatus]|uniref:28S ribosomal protein S24, mitochondrial-like n=1 Tax=Centruroides sculpturatus TaxID=218467 RepID=UPI000C6E0A16|nr:28S ribosomal protein S24, mitochondrial-like [Centruroides sculpturatus]